MEDFKRKQHYLLDGNSIEKGLMKRSRLKNNDRLEGSPITIYYCTSLLNCNKPTYKKKQGLPRTYGQLRHVHSGNLTCSDSWS